MYTQHTYTKHASAHGWGRKREVEKGERKKRAGRGREREEIRERVTTSLMEPSVSHSWSSYDMGSILNIACLVHATLWQILKGSHISK